MAEQQVLEDHLEPPAPKSTSTPNPEVEAPVDLPPAELLTPASAAVSLEVSENVIEGAASQPASATEQRKDVTSPLSQGSRSRSSVRKTRSAVLASDKAALDAYIHKIQRYVADRAEGAATVGGGLFKAFPKLQRYTHGVCKYVADCWIFAFFGWLFVVVHCTALVMVANSIQTSAIEARTLSEVCFIYFCCELLIRLVAADTLYFWQSGWVVFDLFLAVTSIAEEIVSKYTGAVGKGQFIFASMRVLRFIIVLPHFGMPRSGHIISHVLGKSKLAIFVVTCSVLLMWLVAAVVWSSILDDNDVVPDFNTFESSFLTEVLVSANGLDWSRRILQPPGTGESFAEVIRAIGFTVFFVMLVVFLRNVVICIFVEYAADASQSYDKKQEGEYMQRRLKGLELVEEMIMKAAQEENPTALNDSAQDDACNHVFFSDKEIVRQALKQAQSQLDKEHINIEEVLLLFDALKDASEDGMVSMTELLFGIVQLTSPAETAELMQVDYLQRECIHSVKAADEIMERKIQQASDLLDTMRQDAEQLRTFLSSLRGGAKSAMTDLTQRVLEVEQQYQACKADEAEKAFMRGLQKKIAHKQIVEELTGRMDELRGQAASLTQNHHRCRLFGVPSPLDITQACRSAGERDGSSSSSKPLRSSLPQPKGDNAASEMVDHTRFEDAASALRQAVRQRLRVKLARRLEMEVVGSQTVT